MSTRQRVALNDKVIAGIRPPDGRAHVSVFDARQPGLVLQVTRRGRRTWFVWYRDPATRKPKWISVRDPRSGSNEYPTVGLKAARELASDLLKGADDGADLAADIRDRRARTFGTVAAEYVEAYAKPNKASWRADASDIRTQLGAWQARPIAGITRADVRTLLDGIVARGAKRRANRVHTLINGILSFAVDRGYVPFHVATRIAPPTTPGKRSRRFSRVEIHALWQWADQPVPPAPPKPKHAPRDFYKHAATRHRKNRALLKLRLATLARATELLAMRWSDIDWSTDDDGPWWTQPADVTKNGHPNRIPLNRQAVAVLQDLQADATGDDDALVFEGIQGKRQRRGILGTLALKDPWLPRDLRRTGTTNLAQLGVPRFVVDRILNHVDASITADYDYYAYGKEKRDAFDKWAARLDDYIRDPAPATPRLRIVGGAR